MQTITLSTRTLGRLFKESAPMSGLTFRHELSFRLPSFRLLELQKCKGPRAPRCARAFRVTLCLRCGPERSTAEVRVQRRAHGAPRSSPPANCRWPIRRGLGEVRPALRISHAWRAGALLASARKQKSRPKAADFLFPGGSGEIRTHERLTPSAVFKTAAFNHSATLPDPSLYRIHLTPNSTGVPQVKFSHERRAVKGSDIRMTRTKKAK